MNGLHLSKKQAILHSIYTILAKIFKIQNRLIMKKLMTIMLALAMTAGASAQQKSENSDAQAAINNIMTRTSIRQYTDEPVSKTDIETIPKPAQLSPYPISAA